MPYVRPPLISGHIYHVYNRGVEKRPLFTDESDRQHFLDTLSFFLESKPIEKLSRLSRDRLALELSGEPKRPLVRILGYCLMDNHFHLILEQVEDGGISTYMRRALDSYTRYFNRKYDRIGTMFQGRFRIVPVEIDEQLLHLSRYIHLNSYVARLVDDPGSERWSSLDSYRKARVSRLCDPSLVLSIAGSSSRYMDFVHDYANYARTLADIKDLLIDVHS